MHDLRQERAFIAELAKEAWHLNFPNKEQAKTQCCSWLKIFFVETKLDWWSFANVAESIPASVVRVVSSEESPFPQHFMKPKQLCSYCLCSNAAWGNKNVSKGTIFFYAEINSRVLSRAVKKKIVDTTICWTTKYSFPFEGLNSIFYSKYLWKFFADFYSYFPQIREEWVFQKECKIKKTSLKPQGQHNLIYLFLFECSSFLFVCLFSYLPLAREK